MDPNITKFEDLIIRQPTEEMLERIANVDFMKIIIAMKGEAYTGKTTCAEAIAKAYNCSVVSFDHTLDSLSPLAPSPGEAEGLIDLAFDIVIRIVQLQLEVGRPVVVDSPLTKQSHLDKLVALANEFQSCGNPDCNKLHCGFVIVECTPGTKYTWEKRFDDRDKATHDKWYKPKEWNDVVSSCTCKPASDNNPGLPGYVCWLTVDTTFFVPANYRNLGPATLDLCACLKGHFLDFRDWLPHKPYHTGFNPTYVMNRVSGRSHESTNLPDGQLPPITAVNCSDDGRHMLEKVTDAADGLERCRACHIDISYPDEEAYACTRCRLALHKSCAELQEKATIPDPHSNLPSYLQIQSSPEEFYHSIPVEEYKTKYKCSSCTEFSVSCEFCLWEMHLGSRVVPTMVLHEGHHGGDHPIWFWVASAANPREYLCAACRLPGACVGYTCLGGTFKFNFHVECALLPRPVMHVHGGHHHDMEIVFGTNEVKEDYMCDVCQDLILDPAAWYYYCSECNYVSHLRCIYFQE